jgi:hypothetical protein
LGHSSNTYIAGGFMAAAGLAGGEDSSHLFLKDTVAGGRFLDPVSFEE